MPEVTAVVSQAAQNAMIAAYEGGGKKAFEKIVDEHMLALQKVYASGKLSLYFESLPLCKKPAVESGAGSRPDDAPSLEPLYKPRRVGGAPHSKEDDAIPPPVTQFIEKHWQDWPDDSAMNTAFANFLYDQIVAQCVGWWENMPASAGPDASETSKEKIVKTIIHGRQEICEKSNGSLDSSLTESAFREIMGNMLTDQCLERWDATSKDKKPDIPEETKSKMAGWIIATCQETRPGKVMTKTWLAAFLHACKNEQLPEKDAKELFDECMKKYPQPPHDPSKEEYLGEEYEPETAYNGITLLAERFQPYLTRTTFTKATEIIEQFDQMWPLLRGEDFRTGMIEWRAGEILRKHGYFSVLPKNDMQIILWHIYGDSALVRYDTLLKRAYDIVEGRLAPSIIAEYADQ